MLTHLLFIVGFVLLIKGADILVSGASSIAKTLNVSDMVIGLTIVSFGTSICQIELKEDVKTALGLTCLAGIWHDAQRVNLGYILIEFGDFIGEMLVKQERALGDGGVFES